MLQPLLRWSRGPLVIMMLVTASGGVLHGQQATVAGRVVDVSGGALPGAMVSATNVDTGIKSEARTNEEGYYALPLLPPGRYSVTVALEGFQSQTKQEITLQVQQVTRFDFELNVGGVAENVDVRAPLVDSATSSLGHVMDSARIVELPLNGRNPLDLARYTPGVNQLATGFLDTRNFNLTSTSINGGQGGSNAVLIDGGSATLPERNEYVVAPNVDAVQEYRVQTNSVAAEFGMTGGGVINLVTRSGTNQFRGSLFEFLRDDALDATGWTNNRNGLPKSPLSYHQFGGTIGGPIWLPESMGPLAYNGRNRSFFFFNYEGIRYDSSRVNLTRVPTELERQGDFRQTFIRAGNGTLIPVTLYDPATTRQNPGGTGFIRDPFPTPVIPAGRLDPVAVRAMQYYPLPNRTPADATGRENFISTGAIVSDSNQYTGRADHQFTAANKLFVRYSHNDHVNTGNPPTFSADNIADPGLSLQTRHNKHLTIGDTHAFSGRVLGEVRLSVGRQYLLTAPAGYGVNATQEIGMPPIIPATLFPRFNPSPGNLPDLGSLGSSPDQLSQRGLTQGELTGSLSLVWGAHTIKTGVDARVNLRNNYQPGAVSGVFEFSRAMSGNPQDTSGNTGNGLATFLLGAVSSGSLNSPIARADGWYYYAAFLQDDYRIVPRLTLNLGLRYDVITAPTDRFDRYSNFNPTAINPVTGTPGVVQYAGVDFGRQAYDTDFNNIGPRAGFAYDVFGDGRTVVRGGYGVFYYHSASFDYPGTQGFSVTTQFQSPQGTSYPAFQLSAGPSSLLQPSGNSLGPLSFLGNDVTYFERTRPTPTTHQWNVSAQRELPGSTLVELSYAGSRGTHIVGFNYNLNQLPPEYESLGLALDQPVPNPFFGVIPTGPLSGPTITRRQSLRPYPSYLNINVTSPPAYSTKYHSGQIKMERRFAQGLGFLAAYTYSRLVGDVGRNFIDFVTVGGAPQGNVPCIQDARFNRRGCRSIEPQDVTHSLALTGMYELPFGPGQRFFGAGGILGQILGGFQLNAALILRSGLPLFIRGANNGGVADRPNLVGDPRLPDDERTPQRWFNTNAFSPAAPFTTGTAPRTISDARGPGFSSVDAALTKNVLFTDTLRLQFRAEFFNLFNRVNYMQPEMNFLSSGFGTITTAYEPRRVQFGLKLYF